MNETSRAALEVLRSDKKIAWIADQLVASFSEGVTLSVREVSGVGHDLTALTPRERAKRQKHETSRPYEENEKIELIRFALEEVFVAVPSMQIASTKFLREFAPLASSIEFSAPDEEERAEKDYTRQLIGEFPSVENFQRRLQNFCQRLVL